MPVFADTSGLFAALNANDAQHAAARTTWAGLRQQREHLITTNYVLIECIALIERRMGLAAVRDFQANFAPLLEVEWIDRITHEQGIAALLTANRRDLSLVDCVSFEVMRRLGIDEAFAFDPHFTEQGFRSPS